MSARQPDGPRYAERTLPRWAVSNFPAVFGWIEASAERSFVLCERRPGLLEAVFGPRHEVWVGGSGRNRNEVWLGDAEGIPVWILCSERGTVYEASHLGNPWDGSIPSADVDKILRFVARTYVRMEALEPVRKFGRVVSPAEDVVLAEAVRAAEEGWPASPGASPGPGKA